MAGVKTRENGVHLDLAGTRDCYARWRSALSLLMTLSGPESSMSVALIRARAGARRAGWLFYAPCV